MRLMMRKEDRSFTGICMVSFGNNTDLVWSWKTIKVGKSEPQQPVGFSEISQELTKKYELLKEKKDHSSDKKRNVCRIWSSACLWSTLHKAQWRWAGSLLSGVCLWCVAGSDKSSADRQRARVLLRTSSRMSLHCCSRRCRRLRGRSSPGCQWKPPHNPAPSSGGWSSPSGGNRTGDNPPNTAYRAEDGEIRRSPQVRVGHHKMTSRKIFMIYQKVSEPFHLKILRWLSNLLQPTAGLIFSPLADNNGQYFG